MLRIAFFVFVTVGMPCWVLSQNSELSQGGWLSLGGRSTISSFSSDGVGLGTGGQFRLQPANKVNTDWFADYIVVSNTPDVRSIYYHIGWSVLFYPLEQKGVTSIVQPYILAGHCFDYNRKTVIANTAISRGRWGSAAQCGVGTHINLTKRFDVTLMTQYMIHLTKELEVEKNADVYVINNSNNALEGHLLTTISINYKVVKLWNR